MTISKLQSSISNIQKLSFKASKKQYKRAHYQEPIDSFTISRQRTHKKNNSAIKTRIAALLSAAAVAVSGYGGYSIGKGQSDKESYLVGFNDGKQQAYNEIQTQKESIFYPVIETEIIEETPEIEVEQTTQHQTIEEDSIIPEKVYALATDTITELDLTEKPYLFKDESNLPIYFNENNIDLNVLKQAQNNCARVFKSGNYIIISPKQDVTMGEIKRVFGIIDEVIGKDPLNELQTRPQINGSNGNLDNAILGKNDAIRIKTFDEEKGHQIGVYAAHKSNKSRQKIADEILIWANK